MDNPVLQGLADNLKESEPQVEETTNEVQEEQVEESTNETQEETEETEETFETEDTQEEEQETEEDDDKVDNANDSGEGQEEGEDSEWGDGNDWLNTDEKNQPEKKGNSSYDGISEALGLGDFNDEQSVIAEVKNIAKERDELRKAIEDSKNEAPYANEDIKRANDLAKSGGDFNSYLELSQIDYNTIDDNTLLMEGLIKPAFKTDEEAQDYFEGMTEPQKKMEAQRFRNNLIQEQNQKKQDIINKTNDRRQAVNDGIKNILTKTSEMYGMKISNADKKKMFNKLTSEKGLVNDIFYDKKGRMDYDKMVKTAYILENFETIVKSAITKSRNNATKAVMDEATNPNLGTKSKKVSRTEKKSLSPLEVHLESLKNQVR